MRWFVCCCFFLWTTKNSIISRSIAASKCKQLCLQLIPFYYLIRKQFNRMRRWRSMSICRAVFPCLSSLENDDMCRWQKNKINETKQQNGKFVCAFKLVVNRGVWTTRCLSTRLAHSGFGHSHYALALETNQAMKAIPCSQTHIDMCIRASYNSFQNNTNEWINKSILYIFSSEKSVRPASYVACHPTHEICAR